MIYSKLLEASTFGYPSNVGKDELTGAIEWRDLVLMVEGIMEQADSRKQRLETLKKLRK